MFFRSDAKRAANQRPSNQRSSSRMRLRRRLGERSLSCEPLESRAMLATFQHVGPAAVIDGPVEKVTPNNEVSGAIHQVLAHPTNPNVLYAGATNGGIWRTTNATSSNIHWQPMTDHLPSLSIGAMAMDPDNPSRIVAGNGIYSSFAAGGELAGVILTEDAGVTWQVFDDPLLTGVNISGVAVSGDTILATAGSGFYVLSAAPTRGGIFRSTDGGTTWEDVEIFTRDPQFPEERVNFEVFDLQGDPSTPGRYYASVRDEGIFRSDDYGATWTHASLGDARFEQILNLIQGAGLDNNNMEMAVASNGRLYAAITADGQPFFIGYSDSQGGTFTEMDLPLTNETTTGIVGINPEVKPGGQGSIHFSIAADPNDPYTVYIGGDTQTGDLSFDTGNAVGARSFTGRLFRGDTRQAAIGNFIDAPLNAANFTYSPQWEHLTHSDLIPAMPEGGTRRGSAPHADSRDITFDANGDMIQGDDGGIYRRTDPLTNNGDWYSVNGNLQVTEIHSIAYDANSNIVFAGAQDNGTLVQTSTGSRIWQEQRVIEDQVIVGIVSRTIGGDGGDVAIDDTSLANHSIRYSSAQFLRGFRRQVYDANNNLVSETLLDSNLFGNFVTPVILNKLNQSHLVVGGAPAAIAGPFAGIYESFDRGSSFQQVLGPGGASVGILVAEQTSIVYGGRRNGIENSSLLYVGSGAEVFLRTAAGENLRLTESQFPGGNIRGIAIDSHDWANAYVVDRDDVYVTSNAGNSWRRVTGNLHAQGAGEVRKIEFVRSGAGEGFLVVGTNNGLYVTSDQTPGRWAELGTNLPNAIVYDIEYDTQDNVLAVGTLGRGAFLLQNAYAEIRNTASATAANTRASGVVWHDVNGNGTRDAGEPGMAGVRVYVDTNGDDLPGFSEPTAITNANGVYTISNVPPGTYALRTNLQPGYVQTFPSGSGELINNFRNNQQPTNLNFGVWEGRGSEMGFDYGDAPSPFPTRSVDAGASHGIVPNFHLGSTVDGDLNGSPTPFAGGDDNVGDDEDGIVFLTDLVPGTTAEIQVTVSTGVQAAGLLQAWIDFERDGDWSGAGEQVIKDLRIDDGVHTLTINVPSTAVQGFTFARFRYGYEPGLSFTGQAVAGEVEDYRVEVVRGGPLAVDDSFTEIRRNSTDNIFNVLSNDEVRANTNTIIASVSDGTNGGTTSISGNAILYSPAPDYSGSETFTYTLRDRNGLTSTATVSVFVMPDLASIRVGASDLNGTPISSIQVGQPFLMRVFAADLTTPPTGIFAAFTDVQYPSNLVSVTGGLTFGADFVNGQTGSVATAGLVDEAGAFSAIARTGSGELLVFSVPMIARQAGTAALTPNPADNLPQNDVLLYDMDGPVNINQIEYIGTQLNVLAPNAVRFATNPVNPLDVNDDSNVSPFDALLVINRLNSQAVGAEGESVNDGLYLDPSGDGALTPLDALLIINHLNRPNQGTPVAAVAAAVHATSGTQDANEGEGESSRPLTVAETQTKSETELPLTEFDSVFAAIDEDSKSFDVTDDDDLDATIEAII